jgi:hypothetical protein
MLKQADKYSLFRHWYQATDWIMDKTEKLPRHVRPTLGRRIDDYALDIAELILEAIFTPAKARRDLLRHINLLLDKLRILFRLCHDRRYLSTQQYAHVAQLIDDTGKMAGGWLKRL